jgi:hypothetical protein
MLVPYLTSTLLSLESEIMNAEMFHNYNQSSKAGKIQLQK